MHVIWIFYKYRDLYMSICIFFDPFFDYGFMRRAIVACIVLSCSVTPIGVFLIFKRMSLMGDALSHSILPGLAVGYFFSSTSFLIMSIGGFISGLTVAIISNWISERTSFSKDATFSGFCLGFLSLGTILVSCSEHNIDLFHLLFGSILSINLCALRYIGIVSTGTILSLALFYRALVIETFDVEFLRVNNIKFSRWIQVFFLFIVVLNLIASCQITGTLMTLGVMILPGLSARFWVKSLTGVLLLGLCISLLCSWIGLLIAFYFFWPAGPAIILCASIIFIFSLLVGSNEGVLFFLYFRK